MAAGASTSVSGVVQSGVSGAHPSTAVSGPLLGPAQHAPTQEGAMLEQTRVRYWREKERAKMMQT